MKLSSDCQSYTMISMDKKMNASNIIYTKIILIQWQKHFIKKNDFININLSKIVCKTSFDYINLNESVASKFTIITNIIHIHNCIHIA